MDFFKDVLERIDRVIYAVDEWMRYRTGEGRLALVVKPLAALVWFLLTYVVRFAVNILIEPQVNPIKHFPVVTVSHKLMLVLLEPIANLVSAAFGWPLNEARALTLSVMWFIPGIFGFLAWELRENWRLYRANRPTHLRPEAVGAHGETVLRLLRPGFHSGTLPKLYARLRKALRRGRSRAAGGARLSLHHVREEVQRFVERDLLAVLLASRAWGGRGLSVAKVQAGTNRLRVSVACPPGTDPLQLDLEERGWRGPAGLAGAAGRRAGGRVRGGPARLLPPGRRRAGARAGPRPLAG